MSLFYFLRPKEVSRVVSEDGRTTLIAYSDGSAGLVDHAQVYDCPLGHRTVHYPMDRPQVCPVCDLSPLARHRE